MIVRRIGNAGKQGVQFLRDVRWIEQTFGVEGTHSFYKLYLDYEQYFTFNRVTYEALVLSVGTILLVILVITADWIATLSVVLCIVVTDLFLGGLIFFWGLTLNPMVMLNIVISIGTSVDFSAHIAYAYLTEPCPEGRKYNTSGKIRNYKA